MHRGVTTQTLCISDIIGFQNNWLTADPHFHGDDDDDDDDDWNHYYSLRSVVCGDVAKTPARFFCSSLCCCRIPKPRPTG